MGNRSQAAVVASSKSNNEANSQSKAKSKSQEQTQKGGSFYEKFPKGFQPLQTAWKIGTHSDRP